MHAQDAEETKASAALMERKRMYRRHLFEDYGNVILVHSWCDVLSVKIMSNKIIMSIIMCSNFQFEPVVSFLLISENK